MMNYVSIKFRYFIKYFFKIIVDNNDESTGLLKVQTEADVNLSASNSSIGWLVGIEEESGN